MKKIFTIIFLTIFSIGVFAQDLTDVKIYVNPGHGGYNGANDRNVPTIPFELGDTLGFWESSSNLVKGLHLDSLLKKANATVYMSRTLNRDEDDLSLSVIAEEANANSVDAFLSIHSNALGVNSGVNYLLILYHGSDGEPTVKLSLPLAEAAWSRLIDNEITFWSSYGVDKKNIRGDFSFYGNDRGLGVLRPLTVPGFLEEGSFHDYLPETHRLLNIDYKKLHAEQLYRYFCDYFEATLPEKGIISGSVKGKDQHVDDPNFRYKAFTFDEWLPLNGAKVTLMNSGGDSITSYDVDSLYNGVFTFYDLTPGDYKLRFEAENHESRDSSISVTASEIKNVNILLTNPDLPIYSVVPPDYPEPEQEAGVLPMNYYNFELQNDSSEWLKNSNIKKVIYRDDKLYVLTKEPQVLLMDAFSYDTIRTLDLTGIEGGSEILSDINFTSDGTLLGCNKDTITFGGVNGGYFKVYFWDNDSVAPQILFESQAQGNWSKGVVGGTFAVTGAKWNCSIYAPSVTASSSKKIRILGFNHKKDAPLGYKYMIDNSYTEENWGADFGFTISPNSKDNIVVDSKKLHPTEYKFNWMAPDRSPLDLQAAFKEENDYNLNYAASGINFYRNAQHTYMVSPNCEDNMSNVGVVLFDITEGLDAATKISDFLPKEGLGTQTATYMTTFGMAHGYDQDLILFAENEGIARFRTKAPDKKANVYASELRVEKVDDTQKFHFTLNDDIEGGVISLFNDSGESFDIELSALSKGAQVVEALPSLRDGQYSWTVTVYAKATDRPVKITDNTEQQLQFWGPRGIAVDNNFESPGFGRIYACETAGGKVTDRTTTDGVYILNSALEDVTGQGETAYGGDVGWVGNSSPMRLSVAEDGKVYIADFSDNHSGVWAMDAENPNDDFKPVFSQDLSRDENGLASNGGINVHGSMAHCYVLGKGENTQLFTIDEDYVDEVATNGGNILRYDIGTMEKPWDSAPSAIIYNDGENGDLQRNLNSSLAPDGRGGWWLSQFRAADNVLIPSLIHVNSEGKLNFNSGKTPTLIENSYTGGMAVNYEGNKIAMGCRNEVKVFEITYNVDGVPSLTRLHSIKPAMGSYTPGLSFDRAGNLYVISNTTERMGVWALPKIENEFTTPAPKSAVVLITTDVVDIEKSANEFKVYPNPFIDNITLESSDEQIELVYIYDMNGRLIFEKEINNYSTVIDLNSLTPGVYILRAKILDEIISKRLIRR